MIRKLSVAAALVLLTAAHAANLRGADDKGKWPAACCLLPVLDLSVGRQPRAWGVSSEDLAWPWLWLNRSKVHRTPVDRSIRPPSKLCQTPSVHLQPPLLGLAGALWALAGAGRSAGIGSPALCVHPLPLGRVPTLR